MTVLTSGFIALPRALATTALAVVLLAAPVHGATITFSDPTFLDAAWTGVEAIDTTPNNSFSFSATQQAAGGNPGAYRQVINSLNTPTPSQIGSGHFRTGATFDPGQDGTFGSLDMSLSGIGISGPAGAMAYGALLEQGGFYYSFSFGQVLNGHGWAAFGQNGLTEGDFTALNGGILDLSNAGGLVSLGFIVTNGTFNDPPGTPSVNEGGADNWSVSIHTVTIPEPGPLALFALGLAGLAYVRRRSRAI